MRTSRVRHTLYQPCLLSRPVHPWVSEKPIIHASVLILVPLLIRGPDCSYDAGRVGTFVQRFVANFILLLSHFEALWQFHSSRIKMDTFWRCFSSCRPEIFKWGLAGISFPAWPCVFPQFRMGVCHWVPENLTLFQTLKRHNLASLFQTKFWK